MQTQVANTVNFGMASYDTLMSYIHSVRIPRDVKEHVGRRLMQEVTEPYLSRTFEKVDEISALEDGWAGEGSYAVSKEVLSNIKRVLLISDNDDWKKWFIGPDVNATIGLQSEDGAMMSLGAEEFSYYVVRNGKKTTGSHISFDAAQFLDVMRKIA